MQLCKGEEKPKSECDRRERVRERGRAERKRKAHSKERDRERDRERGTEQSRREERISAMNEVASHSTVCAAKRTHKGREAKRRKEKRKTGGCLIGAHSDLPLKGASRVERRNAEAE